jgi:D-alanyl-D-alanine carboxypeptidase
VDERMPRRTVLVGATALAATLGTAQPAAALDPDGLATRLVAALHRLQTPDIPGIAAAVHGPRLRWSGAVGSLMLGGTEPLRPRHTFRLASVTKLVTAATVLRLVEQGALGLDDSIAEHLEQDVVERIAVIDGVAHGPEVTVGMLLDHTSGVSDHGSDLGYFAAVLADPRHRWTPREQVEFAIAHGRPYFPPGTGFHYSDTAYVLAGQVVERVTGKPLHRAMRRLVLDPLRLRRTYTESLERPPTGTAPRAHQYYRSLDTYDVDPSFDLYGGGGLVSTVGDVVRLLRGLFRGRLFHRDGTLELMTAPSRFGNYGMGFARIELDGADAVGKAGFGGVFAAYVPARDLFVATTTNCAGEGAAGNVRLPAQEIARVVRESGSG